MPRNDSVGPSWLPSAGVVVDDVEDDLDAGLVQALDRGLELGDRAARQKARIGGEKRRSSCSPSNWSDRADGRRCSVIAAWTGSSSTAVTPSPTR